MSEAETEQQSRGHGGEPPWKSWRDDPITALDQDRFRRAPIAQRAAQLIDENHSRDSSVVYGLEGPWGSGKSSVIALMSFYLKEPEPSPWQVVHFTPWATSGTEGMLTEFFAALATVVPAHGSRKNLRHLIADYADIARPFAALVPVAGTAIVEASRTLEARLAKPWDVAFEEVATELRELGAPVLVVVDDIDRLQPSELLDLLKVVRLLGRFPGVDFLLAYDEQTLIETLHRPGQSGLSKARARAFMEKIVQYPLSIPPLLTGQIVKMLSAGLTDIVTPKRIDSDFDKHRFSDIILNTMPSQLTTPRAIERLLAQVREQFRVHDPDEIDVVDLILAVFLRVQFPDVFTQLQSWKALLTRSIPTYLSPSKRKEEQPEWDRLVKDLDRDEDRRDALAVLVALFPAVRDVTNPRARAGRFAHPDYFDRYLAQAIPEGDIPDADVSRALEDAATGNTAGLRRLVATDDDEQVTLALSKIHGRYPDVGQDRYHDGPKGPVTLDLLATGMALLDEAEDRQSTWTSTALQLTHWTAIVLRQILDADPHAEIDSALKKCTRMDRRSHVISTAARDVEHLNEETRQALQDALFREVERIVPVLLDDLRQGDQSSTEAATRSAFLYGLVAESSALADFQAQIQSGLQEDEFTPADIAARLVGLSYIVGGSGQPSAASFSEDLFTTITGIDARSSQHTHTGKWTDTTWPSLRKYAEQFISPRPNTPVTPGDGGDLPE